MLGKSQHGRNREDYHPAAEHPVFVGKCVICAVHSLLQNSERLPLEGGEGGGDVGTIP